MATLGSALMTSMDPLAGIPMERTSRRVNMNEGLLRMLIPLALGAVTAGATAASIRSLLRSGKTKSASLWDDVMSAELAGSRNPVKGMRFRNYSSLQDHSPTAATITQDTYNDLTGGVAGGRHPIDIGFTRDVPVFDWDLGPFEGGVRNRSVLAHPRMKEEVAVENLAELLDIARERASRLQREGIPSSLQLYMTPGGYRGIETGFKATPRVAMSDFLAPKKLDPSYQLGVQQPTVVAPKEGVSGPTRVMRPAYGMRTSTKPGRAPSDDFGAGYIGSVSTGDQLKSSVSEMLTVHDGPVEYLMSKNNAMKAFLESVSMELNNLNGRDADTVVKAIARRYGIPSSAIPTAMIAAGLTSAGTTGGSYGDTR